MVPHAARAERPLTADAPPPISILDLDAAEAWCTAHGLQPMHLRAVYRSVFRDGVGLDPSALSRAGVPARVAAELCARFVACGSRVVESRESAGGGRKLLVELGSGARVETVRILSLIHI